MMRLLRSDRSSSWIPNIFTTPIIKTSSPNTWHLHQCQRFRRDLRASTMHLDCSCVSWFQIIGIFPTNLNSSTTSADFHHLASRICWSIHSGQRPAHLSVYVPHNCNVFFITIRVVKSVSMTNNFWTSGDVHASIIHHFPNCTFHHFRSLYGTTLLSIVGGALIQEGSLLGCRLRECLQIVVQDFPASYPIGSSIQRFLALLDLSYLLRLLYVHVQSRRNLTSILSETNADRYPRMCSSLFDLDCDEINHTVHAHVSIQHGAWHNVGFMTQIIRRLARTADEWTLCKMQLCTENPFSWSYCGVIFPLLHRNQRPWNKFRSTIPKCKVIATQKQFRYGHPPHRTPIFWSRAKFFLRCSLVQLTGSSGVGLLLNDLILPKVCIIGCMLT